MSHYLLIIGGTVFSMMGLIHAIYTICDIYRPKHFVPLDPTVMDHMASTGVRFARGRTTMWEAWLGFNISHGLGLVIFGLVCVGAGVFGRTVAMPRAILLISVVVGVIYLLLAVRFWFRLPAVGFAIGTGFLFMGWMLY